MAILDTENRLHGRIGDLIYYQRNGKIHTRQAPRHPQHVARTEAAMRQRLRITNLINMWKVFPDGGKPYYETRHGKGTDYNEFVSANMRQLPIYLTRRQAADNDCVVTPAQVSRGCLPTIVTTDTPQGVRSSITVDDSRFTPNTTVADASLSLIRHNTMLTDGDELLFIHLAQHRDTDGRPFAVGQSARLKLDICDHTPLRYHVHDSVGFVAIDGHLTAAVAPTDAVAWIHLRPVPRGRTLASTQQLHCHNEELIEHYTSDSAFNEARESY